METDFLEGERFAKKELTKLHIEYGLELSLMKAEELYYKYSEEKECSSFAEGYIKGIEKYFAKNSYCSEPIRMLKLNSGLYGGNYKNKPEEKVLVGPPRQNKKSPTTWDDEDEKLIYSAVKKATGDFHFIPRGYEKNDLLQECSAAWYENKHKHDSGIGKKSTFLFKIVERRVIDLIRKTDSEKRKGDKEAIEYFEHGGGIDEEYNPVKRGASIRRKIVAENEPEIVNKI